MGITWNSCRTIAANPLAERATTLAQNSALMIQQQRLAEFRFDADTHDDGHHAQRGVLVRSRIERLSGDGCTPSPLGCSGECSSSATAMNCRSWRSSMFLTRMSG